MAYIMLLYINGFYLIGVTEDDFPVKIRVIFRVKLLIYQRVIINHLQIKVNLCCANGKLLFGILTS